MAWGLPKLPGLTFTDPTKTSHHMCSSLRIYQGYRFPDTKVIAPGGTPTDVESNAFMDFEDSANYDPSLTYGRVKQPALPTVVPHFVSYDKKCLNFTAFLKQPVFDSPIEHYRVRIVNLIYFLEDDTMLVAEPKIRNCGLTQGKMVKRGKLPKNDLGDAWHWKDLDVGKDIAIYGKVFHTVTCDNYTKEFLLSQGIEVQPDEEMPTDPFTLKERAKMNPNMSAKKAGGSDSLRRYLEYDGKVLQFDCYWDDRESEYGELRPYKLIYFLQDDTISIKEVQDPKGGRDPFPMLLKKFKVPKKWKEKPISFPGIVLEKTDEEVTEYYAPIDLRIGETLFILGRKFLLTECDPFTRNYYRSVLGIEQPGPIILPSKRGKTSFEKVLPPHIGIGTAEDSLQSCFSLMPKPPHKDIIKYNLNMNKNLRYLLILDTPHPEDVGRKFVMKYSLADSSVIIGEIPRRNSGIREGTFLKKMLLQTPDSDPNFPTYYTPDKFYIGAIIPVFKHRFKIIGCDLYVYRYMCANPEKFPKEIVDNVRNYHMREGNLRDDFEAACAEEEAADRRTKLAQLGSAAVAEPSAMEKCLTQLDVVEGQAAPYAAPKPPPRTDTIDYDEYLAVRRKKEMQKSTSHPKGILKSGSAGTDKKAVCFHDKVAVSEQSAARDIETSHLKYRPPQKERPLWSHQEDFCEEFKDVEGQRMRDSNICPYPPNVNLDTAQPEAIWNPQKAQEPFLMKNYKVDCYGKPVTEEHVAPKDVNLTPTAKVCEGDNEMFDKPVPLPPPPCCQDVTNTKIC